jgi:H+/Cl- antiporter ClcA
MSAPHHLPERRDFSGDLRLLLIAAIAAVIGGLAVLAAHVLLLLIRFFTDLFFYQRFSIADLSPAHHTLGAWVIAVPVIGGLVIGLIARYGTEQIRGHGIPEAIEAILFKDSAMSPKVAVLKPLASGIAIGSGGPFGAEGPIIMTGGAIGSLIAQHFHLTGGERKSLLVAGAVSGMTAVFGTPVAARADGGRAAAVRTAPAQPAAGGRGLRGGRLPAPAGDGGRAAVSAADHAGGPAGPAVLRAGRPAVRRAVLVLMSTALYKVEDWFHKLPIHWMWWPALGALAVGIGGYFQPRALGVGYDVIGDLLHNHLAMGAVLALLASSS